MQRRKALMLYYRELERRAKRSQRPKLIDETFARQAGFIRDPAKLKAAKCTRRSGKSYGGALVLFETALENPGASVLYIALTRDSAKKIMWKDCIKTINRKHDLNCKFNETELTATLPNGSVIYLTGADAKPDEMEKLLGQKYAVVVIDEAASYRINLRDLVYKILKPAVADYRGQIVLIGTPSNIVNGLFFDITNGKEPGWSYHEWSAFDNPYMVGNWQAEIDDLVMINPLVKETPWFKQMYLGEWVIESDKLVYRYDPKRNAIARLPDEPMHYVLGVDLGYDPDPSAFVLCGYTDHRPELFIIETYKQRKMIISDVAERIRYYQRRFSHLRIVVDAADKQSIEEMRQREGLPLVAAEKHGKAGFIEIMNSDFIMGYIKVVADQCESLIQEWSTLVWDEHATRRQEDPACDNHEADGALYGWRWCYNYAWTNRPKAKARPDSEQAIDQFWEQEEKRITRKGFYDEHSEL